MFSSEQGLRPHHGPDNLRGWRVDGERMSQATISESNRRAERSQSKGNFSFGGNTRLNWFDLSQGQVLGSDVCISTQEE